MTEMLLDIDYAVEYPQAVKNELRDIRDPEVYYDRINIPVREWLMEWDYTKSRIDIYTHQIHQYPAMFIPQVVRKLLIEYTYEGDLVLDIFNGSGTTTVECGLTRRKSIGLERNPLAHLIASVKTTPIDTEMLIESYRRLTALYFDENHPGELIEFENIDFWFSKESIFYLSHLLNCIRKEEDMHFRNVFEVTFSSIVREVSLVRHNGFKLHRDKKKLNKVWKKHEIFDFFHYAFKKSLAGLVQLSMKEDFVRPELRCIDTTKFQGDLQGCADFIVTSPPYGDSRTTVAYGQFSRLSSQWLGLIGTNDSGAMENIDNKLLGGMRNGVELEHPILERSNTLRTSLLAFSYLIEKAPEDKKKKFVERARDVLAFYIDLEKTICNGSRYLRDEKYFILVTGSRTVKGIKLNTDLIIAELGEHYELLLDGILYRKSIPNKRMPRKVSPSNIVGDVAPTMSKESIILLRKGKTSHEIK